MDVFLVVYVILMMIIVIIKLIICVTVITDVSLSKSFKQTTMIIPILIFAMLAIGIIGIIAIGDADEATGFCVMTFIGAVFSIISIVIIICVSTGNVDFRNEYAIQSAYVEAVSGNNSLTADERVNVIRVANDINSEILTSRSWGKNVWVGWYVRNSPAEYSLIDVSRITNANQQVTINVNDTIIGK